MTIKRIICSFIIALTLINVCFACGSAPVAVLELAHYTPSDFILIGKTVQFDASSSYDLDEDIDTYEWDFSYDGHTFNAESGYTTDEVSYELLGELGGKQQRGYTVAVRVTDDLDNSTIETIVIHSKTDEDGDYLPDEWELDNFGDLSQTAAGNPDGDYLFTGDYNRQPYNNLCELKHNLIFKP
jgi:hypothetical protein